MMSYFVYFFIYSFIGFLLESIYTLITKGCFLWKKCFLFNYLCPVYGLGAISILFSVRNIREYKLLSVFVGSIIATLVEFIFHLLYEEFLGISLWDYSDYLFNIQGRVCITFTIFWSILSGLLIYVVHPVVKKYTASIPKPFVITIMIFLAIDAVISVILLKKYGNKNAVNISWLISNYHYKLH